MAPSGPVSSGKYVELAPDSATNAGGADRLSLSLVDDGTAGDETEADGTAGDGTGDDDETAGEETAGEETAGDGAEDGGVRAGGAGNAARADVGRAAWVRDWPSSPPARGPGPDAPAGSLRSG